MIEAPEALYLSQQLNKVIKEKTITDVIVGFTPHKFMFLSDKVENYQRLLLNKRIDTIDAKGGMVEIMAKDTILLFTDGVNLQYYEAGAKLPAKHQVLIGFEDQSCILGSIRMYGGVLCFKEGKFHSSIASYYLTARSKPQIMSNDFTKEYFLSLFEEEEVGKKSAKAFLATGQNIPGLGNGVLQDILYNAEIHPKTKINTLSDQYKEKLYDAIIGTMQEIYRLNGRDSETDLFGVKGKYIPYLSKDTVGKECKRCDGIIKKEAYLGGSIYYCEGCQR